jgi:hypothetical protein
MRCLLRLACLQFHDLLRISTVPLARPHASTSFILTSPFLYHFNISYTLCTSYDAYDDDLLIKIGAFKHLILPFSIVLKFNQHIKRTFYAPTK